jgi:hypothetical protein
MRAPVWIRTAAAAAIALLAACTGGVRLNNAWLSDLYHGPAFTKIIVLGVGEDGATRRLFEDSFTVSLTRAGVQAYPGYTLLPGVDDPTADQVRQAAQRIGADGALVTRLLRVERRTEATPGYVRVRPAYGYRGGFYGFYGGYRGVAVVTPPSSYSYDVAELETNLWALDEAGTLVWSATSQSFSPGKASDLGSDLATEVSDALKAAGLLRGPQG